MTRIGDQLRHWFGRHQRPLRFLAVGALNTVFGYSVYALLLWLSANYVVAATGSTVLGLLFNFRSTGPIVFGSRNNDLFWRFLLVNAVVFLVNLLALTLLVRTGVDPLVSGAMLMLPLAALSYALNSHYVFGAR